MEEVNTDAQAQSSIPEPSEMSVGIAQVIEIYVQSKADGLAREMVAELQQQLEVVEERMAATKAEYPAKIIAFAEKLSKRHTAMTVKDEVLDRYLAHFGLSIKQTPVVPSVAPEASPTVN